MSVTKTTCSSSKLHVHVLMCPPGNTIANGTTVGVGGSKQVTWCCHVMSYTLALRCGGFIVYRCTECGMMGGDYQGPGLGCHGYMVCCSSGIVHPWITYTSHYSLSFSKCLGVSSMRTCSCFQKWQFVIFDFLDRKMSVLIE